MEDRYIKEFIDDMLSDRYNRCRETDLTVDNDFFNLVITTMRPVIENLSNSYIPGFIQEDLEDLFIQRTHQILRRGQFDTDRLPFGLFSVTYRNILNEICFIRNRELKKDCMHCDALDNLVKWRSDDVEQKHTTN